MEIRQSVSVAEEMGIRNEYGRKASLFIANALIVIPAPFTSLIRQELDQRFADQHPEGRCPQAVLSEKYFCWCSRIVPNS
jgi:hypothetical protein